MLKNQKLLVTGITGNLAGALAARLVRDNEVWAIARFSEAGQRDYWKQAGIHTVVGDFGKGELSGLPDDFDYVIHSGASTTPETFEEGMQGNPVGTGLLMAHCRKAKAFMHLSAAAVYAEYPDPEHWVTEDDLTGSCGMGHYNGTKLAAEGAVHALAAHLGLPSIICRIGVQYGPYKMGGLPGVFLAMLKAGMKIPLPARQHNIHMPISDDDIFRFVEPTLKAAKVPVVTINFGGDDPVSAVDMIEYLSELSGLKADYEITDAVNYPTVRMDPTRRKAITGPCQVHWKDGFKRLYEELKDRPIHESITRPSPASVTG